ncbi:tetratricopeptide repeat protein [Plantibacter sp. YIM 135249]|uniref:tetratricopeptide repeat protein n=1 Tax=Plantibacter sp. YIM 135249 TaxID=3423918 RepID=UPI003D34E426
MSVPNEPAPAATWDERVDAVWDASAEGGELATISLIDALVAERPAGDAAGLFEAAGARDSAGLEAEAEPLYRAALAAGLDEERRPQAVIQLASTIRNLGQVDESVAMLRTELAAHPDGPLADAAKAFLALSLATRGDTLEATSIAVGALAGHLPRYRRSVTGYAAELLEH